MAALISMLVGSLFIIWGCWSRWYRDDSFYFGGQSYVLASYAYTFGFITGAILVGTGLLSVTYLCKR
jgi:hypothetical protein